MCVAHTNEKKKSSTRIKEIWSDDDRAGYVVGENTGEAKVATDHRVGRAQPSAEGQSEQQRQVNDKKTG